MMVKGEKARAELICTSSFLSICSFVLWPRNRQASAEVCRFFLMRGGAFLQQPELFERGKKRKGYLAIKVHKDLVLQAKLSVGITLEKADKKVYDTSGLNHCLR